MIVQYLMRGRSDALKRIWQAIVMLLTLLGLFGVSNSIDIAANFR